MTSPATRVRFPSGSAFHADLKARVEASFRGRDAHGGWPLRVKSAVLGAWLAASWALLVFAPVGALAAAALSISVGLAMAGIGFCVMHDANHGSFSRNPRTNRLLSFTSDVLGASSHLWRHKHNVLHHTYTNVAGHDLDLEPSAMLRFAPWQERRGYHRYQHWYVWILYAAFPLKWWFVDDVRELWTGRMASRPYPRARGRQLVWAVLGKLTFVAWAFVVPAILHPTWKLVPLWLLAVGTLGVVTAVVFQLAHCVGRADFAEAAPSGDLESGWAEHQLATTVDFAQTNRLLRWYLGGLNFQIEHHLFPRISHVHYPEVARIVRATCEEHGLAYAVEPTLSGALAANVRWLREMGREPHRAPLRARAPRLVHS